MRDSDNNKCSENDYQIIVNNNRSYKDVLLSEFVMHITFSSKSQVALSNRVDATIEFKCTDTKKGTVMILGETGKL